MAACEIGTKTDEKYQLQKNIIYKSQTRMFSIRFTFLCITISSMGSSISSISRVIGAAGNL